MRSDGYAAIVTRALDAFRARRSGSHPVWMPTEDLEGLLSGADGRLPVDGQGHEAPLAFLLEEVLTRPTGNTSPKFFGWVHGGGDELGVAAAIISAAMNSNTGGRDHGAVHVEVTLLAWMREVFGFGDTSSGVLTQGTSEANLLALATARTAARKLGKGQDDPRREILYAGADVHDSADKASRLLQFGPTRVASDAHGSPRMCPDELRRLIRQDRAEGLVPTCVIATAGSVDSGACDPLVAIAEVCREERVWMHVDGAFGAWLRIAPPPFDTPVRGLELADSLAFDFHKWLPVPFAVGALLVKDADVHRRTFANKAPYLSQGRALSGGPDWAVNYGIALSRPFQGLAPYLILRTYGLRQLGQGVAYCVVLAHYFAHLIDASERFTVVEPVVGNVVLFATVPALEDAGRADDIAAALQERGESVFSTTTWKGRSVLRACFVNHKTRPEHVEEAVQELEGQVERLNSTI